MVMLVKSFTVSNSLTVTHTTNGRETGKTIHSEPGVRAELMLQSNDKWKVRANPSGAHVSLSIDIDQPPNLNPSEMRVWIRDQLIELLADPVREEVE
ncbi:hypothetical protein ASF09_03185 [Sphingomonas sp. Leaf242]|nr:hypothetical protein ASF09_03185 [Sphingomonas sp. Leaf242]